MKRLLLLFVAFVFLLSGVVPLACAGQNTVTFEWEQPGDLTDFHSWRLHVADTVGGPYDDGMTYFRDTVGNSIPYVEILFAGPGTTYVGDAIILVPDGAETNLCFVLDAWDTEGNFSTYSNEVCENFDFLPPGIPVNFKVKVKTRP